MNKESGVIAAIAVVVIGIVVALFAFSGKSGVSGPTADTATLVREESYKTGAVNPKVTVVEFGDYQCPACGVAAPIIEQIVKERQDMVQLVFRNFPLSQHQNALAAAKAVEAAGKQGKFWAMYDKVYAGQSDWSENSAAKAIFANYAKDLGLNADTFQKDVDSPEITAKIDRDSKDGETVGVNSTPTFYLNGQKYQGRLDKTEMLKAIDAAVK